ncbi:CHAT domain-containing protein [Catenulispora yoronensis]
MEIARDQDADAEDRAAAQKGIAEILRWLWDAAVSDILSALGFVDPLPEADSDASATRRLWWCPVGGLAFLPLHAAGHHQDLTGDDPGVRANPRTAFDRVVSSYTPTLQSLAFARSHVPDPALRGTVAIAVTDAEGMPLPSADAEAAAIEATLPAVRVLTEPTRDEVIAALPDYLTAHFACHGVAFADPGASRLILADHQDRPLTVADLQGLRLSAGLAYLSACETSLSSVELVDEAVHLTGAFHLAGYRHVIGTLWPIGTFASQRLAADFYRRLAPDQAEPLALDGTARALHSALRALRSKFPGVPSAWAAHVHIGP